MPAEETKALDDQYIAIIIGALAACLVLLLAIVLFVFIRHRRRKFSNSNEKQMEHPVTLNLNDLRSLTNGKVSNGNMYNSIATQEEMEQTTPSSPPHEDVMIPPPAGETRKVANGDMYREPFDGIQGRKLPELPPLKTPDSAGLWV